MFLFKNKKTKNVLPRDNMLCYSAVYAIAI